MADQKCCGTCRWAKAYGDTGKDLYSVGCFAPNPDSSYGDVYGRKTMRSDDGTDCPCYQPQETTDDE